MHNFIDANKIDSGDLYVGEKQCTMLNKCQFFYALFEHCTDKIYNPVTEQRLNHHIGSKSNDSKKSMAEFVELAQTLGTEDGHKSHEVTIKLMKSWHRFGRNVYVRNKVTFSTRLKQVILWVVVKYPKFLVILFLMNWQTNVYIPKQLGKISQPLQWWM